MSFVVNDGALNSGAAIRSITVAAVNDAPIVTASGGALAYAENQAATAIDPGLTVSDLDNVNLTGATVSITANYISGQDVLGFTNQNGISYHWNAAAGMLTLSGTSSVANYQSALRSVTYANTTDDPRSPARTVSFAVNDGALSSSAATRSVDISPVNDAPVAINLDTAETYTEDRALNLTGIVISDVDSVMVSATLQLSNPEAASLNVATAGSVTSSYDAAAGIWTAGGPIADVNALLASLILTPSPHFNAEFSIRAEISDGIAAPIVGSQLMTGTPVNDAPSTKPVTLQPIAEDSGPRLITQPNCSRMQPISTGRASPRSSSPSAAAPARWSTTATAPGPITPALDDDSVGRLQLHRHRRQPERCRQRRRWTSPRSTTPPLISLAPLDLQGGASVLVDSSLLQASDVDNQASQPELRRHRRAATAISNRSTRRASQSRSSARPMSPPGASSSSRPARSVRRASAWSPFDGNSRGSTITASIDFRRSVLVQRLPMRSPVTSPAGAPDARESAPASTPRWRLPMDGSARSSASTAN